MSVSVSICWFRRDLRLDDQPALRAAMAAGGPVLPVFIAAPEEEAPWSPGAASRWWLHHSLKNLAVALQKLGSRLVIRRGPSLEALKSLLSETGAKRIFWNRLYEPALRQRDAAVEAALKSQGVEVQTFPDSLLFEPLEILNQSKQPFQVFTPFWKACQTRAIPGEPKRAPKKLPVPKTWPSGVRLEKLSLLPAIDWTAGMRAAWQPGAAGAEGMLQAFATDLLAGYSTGRDTPDCRGTSHLSPHLHFGEISPRRVWHTVNRAAGGKPGGPIAVAAEPYLRQLGWREFAHYLLYHFPHTSDKPLRSEFNRFPWHRNSAWLRCWQHGRTGYPLVDAGMRQLWDTGWMHNRVRMVVASFLVKHLLISWQAGAHWFWDTLVDADLANNTLGWQWTAGCGADAAPFFRIFNPVLQGKKFDPEGNYVRRWVPELKNLPAAWIHQPWRAPPEVLAAAAIRLGHTYPKPIVAHEAARKKALSALKSLRK